MSANNKKKLQWRMASARYKKRYPERVNAQQKRLRDKYRAKIITHYGGRCVCCGESEPKFLSIDHINGDGRKHRELIGAGKQGKAYGTFYRWIIAHNFPLTLQLLCYNCNLSKGFYGKCPHQDDVSK